ncbi:hypothetical protein FNV43_RR21583 [Rhamnella rubrinervis]|uniref:Uncharacterized protein n=1 Tax=Rhamnella rubrinervis TaxID=2594499 RepID=A0A8K0DSQ9_9ROSA|nr:hypothetical protein FNV43_RR21583 [Rhamnella rubrinervis]
MSYVWQFMALNAVIKYRKENHLVEVPLTNECGDMDSHMYGYVLVSTGKYVEERDLAEEPSPKRHKESSNLLSTFDVEWLDISTMEESVNQDLERKRHEVA